MTMMISISLVKRHCKPWT